MIASLNRDMALRTAFLVLFLSWPLFFFGHPSHVVDSASYLKGGAVAVEFVAKRLPGSGTEAPLNGAVVGSSSAQSAAAPAREEPKAARSVTYSVAAYLLRWPAPDMTALAVLQSISAAFVVAVAARVVGMTSIWFMATTFVMAFATPLAALSATICPDLYAGIAIAGILLFALAVDRMSLGVKVGMAALIAFSITTHASIPPIAFGMIFMSAGYWFLKGQQNWRPNRWDWLWLLAPTVVGMAITVGVGFVAFGEVSVAAKRFPLALSRSVVDGPARWYLQRECVVPRYAVCEVFGTKIPFGTNEFLFDKTGLKGRATPEQMDRIRAEEAEIVFRAAMAYPGTELQRVLTKTVKQLVRFSPENTQFNERVVIGVGGVPQTVTISDQKPTAVRALEIATVLGLVASLLWLIANASRLRRGDVAALALLSAGLVGNAFVCVAFSALSDRYQERVIWLVPLLILIIGFQLWQRSERRI